MVIYDLICDTQHEFEGWFKNAEDFISQCNRAILCCPICNSSAISKKLTAPKLSRKSNSTVAKQGRSNLDSVANAESAEAYAKMQTMLKKVHEHVDANFKDVGNAFADQALSMHRGEREATNIRGTANRDQLRNLAEEGVTALPLPEKPVDKTKLN